MRRVLATVVLVLAAVVGLPATAQAGGPTSVLITQVGASAGALYVTDEAYDDLAALLPDAETKGGAEPAAGIDYNLTWLIHDVSIWRYDRVRVTRDGTAWVSTSFTNDAPAGWQEVVPSAKLVQILDAVQSDTAVDTVSLVPDAKPASTPPAATPPAEPDTAWFSVTGWRWVVPGALLGLLVGVAAARVRRTQEDEPRRVLVEA